MTEDKLEIIQLQRNVMELQKQLQEAYKRIDQINENSFSLKKWLEICKKYPNDAKLGECIRQMYYESI